MEACASAVITKFHVVGLKKSTDWGSPEGLARQLITQSGQSDGHDDLYHERNSLRRKCVKSKLKGMQRGVEVQLYSFSVGATWK
jgi:hypothetical protein